MPDGTGIGRKIIKPINCVLAFGIPTSREGFVEWEGRPEKDFVQGFLGGWPQYDHLVVSIFNSIEPVLREWKVTVIQDLTVAGLGSLFRNRFDVIILFSHWKGDAVELFDGFVDPCGFLKQVPEEFSGLIDLCVCHPCALTLALRRYRNKCLVKDITTKATPGFWLYFYLALFKLLKDEDLTYLAALERVVDMFIKKGRHDE